MLRFARTALLIANGIVIPASLFLGGVLVYGVQPVEYTWVTGATENNGVVTGQLTPACEPRILPVAFYSREALAKFAAEAVVDLNTFDYLNWDVVVAAASQRYMTPNAARVFLGTFEQGRLLAGVKREYLSVSARLVSPPILIRSSKTPSTQRWTVQVPVQVFYGTGAQTVAGVKVLDNMTQTLVFTVELEAQPPTDNNFRGIAISAMTATRIQNPSVLEQLRQGDLS